MDVDAILNKITWYDVLNLPSDGFFDPYRFIKDDQTFRILEERFEVDDSTRMSLELIDSVHEHNFNLANWIFYAVACYSLELEGFERFAIAMHIESFGYLHKTYEEIPGMDALMDEALDQKRELLREKRARER